MAPTSVLTLQLAEVGFASPPLPALFISAFCLEGGVVFHNYLKNAKQGVPESRIGPPPGRRVHPRRHPVSPTSPAGCLCGSALLALPSPAGAQTRNPPGFQARGGRGTLPASGLPLAYLPFPPPCLEFCPGRAKQTNKKPTRNEPPLHIMERKYFCRFLFFYNYACKK